MSKKRKPIIEEIHSAELAEADVVPMEEITAAEDGGDTEENQSEDESGADESVPVRVSPCPSMSDEELPSPVEAEIQELPQDDSPPEPTLAEDAAEGAVIVESTEELPPLKITSLAQARSVAEALLFISNEPLSVKRLAKVMGDMNVNDVRGVLAQMAEEYDRERRGVQLVEVAGGFQLSTRPEYADWILQLLGQKRRSPLTGAALETLAIIAYKQPITRAEVDAIRGVESGGVVRTLLDLELIEVKGRKEVLGKPQLYGTSEKFLRAFGLKRLEDLPSILELREHYQTGPRT